MGSISGVSFTIYEPESTGYLQGNIETGMLTKMMAKAGIESRAMNYGVVYKDANLKRLKASAKGAEKAEPAKDKESPRLETVSKSKHHEVIYKKRRGFKRFFC